MKINHIGLNCFSWARYWDNKNKESTYEIYKLIIYRNKKYSYDGYRYRLLSHENSLRYHYRTILKTNSREEIKMTLDLMGLKIEKVNIIMEENSASEMIIPYTVIELT